MDLSLFSGLSGLDWIFPGSADLPLEALRIAVALLGTGIGAYYDLFNNKNVPNNFLYAFLGLAFLVNLVAFDSVATTYGVVSGLVVFGLTWILYKTGKLGGADVFILAALTLLLPLQPRSLLMAPPSVLPSLPFIFSVLLASGLSFMAYMFARSLPVVVKAVSTPGTIKPMSWVSAFAIVVVYGAFAYMVSTLAFLSPAYFLFLTVVVGASVYFTLFKDALNDSMAELVPVSKVEEEDVLPIDKMDAALVKKYKLGPLVDAAMLKRLKAHKGKVLVMKHLPPYIPHLLLGLILSLVVGNIVLYVATPGTFGAY